MAVEYDEVSHVFEMLNDISKKLEYEIFFTEMDYFLIELQFF